MNAAIVNTIGLCANMLGALLLFFFGLPSAINREGQSALLLEHTDEPMKKRARWYDRLGNLGLGLLFLGFTFQLIANWMHP